MKKKTVNADESIVNYIQSMSSHRPSEDNPKKFFLLSLLPDLEVIQPNSDTMWSTVLIKLLGNNYQRPIHQYTLMLCTEVNLYWHPTWHLISKQIFNIIKKSSSSFDSQSHTSEQTSSELDHPDMLYQDFNHIWLENHKNDTISFFPLNFY